ncbi:glycerate kinase [Eudoraea chungangensis]|uniref:glycerate kinase n=1 Tax=Eudoraea chungangensis TaxID=1481905 RepID=UPI0023ED8CD1|nr:glycerate kinase [Eudoraea chungangensis]
MNFLLIPDKFKGSLTASQIIRITEKEVLDKYPSANVRSIIASDGGDGFLDSVLQFEQVNRIDVPSVDALGRSINSHYLLNAKQCKAYIELANTCGLILLDREELNPLKASTYGLGIQIKDALERGAKDIYIGLGGSATNDGGIGMASALGYKFLNKKGQRLEANGDALNKITSIDSSRVLKNLSSTKFIAVNDVTNPLFGSNGATAVYGKQKGVNKDEIDVLEKGLINLDNIVAEELHMHVAEVPGAGAAGGSAYGLMCFFGASFIGGINFVLQKAGVPRLLENEEIDFIITGEGKIDSQSLQGKLIDGVINLGSSYQIPIILICGLLEIDKNILYPRGVSKIVEICDREKPIQYSIDNAAVLLKRGLEAVL